MSQAPEFHGKLPAPPRLFELFERGIITREAWLEGMRAHSLCALAEIQRDRLEPHETWLERMRAGMAARRAMKSCRESELRELLVALSRVEDFPLSAYLWNADQSDAPLFCFFRETRWPVFRLLESRIERLRAEAVVEYGSVKKALRQRERFLFRRDWRGVLRLEMREVL